MREVNRLSKDELKHHHAPFDDLLFTDFVLIVDDVIVNGVFVKMPIDGAIPAEGLVGGVKHQCAPTVVDGYVKASV